MPQFIRLNAHVTTASLHPAGQQIIRVQFYADAPVSVIHKGQIFAFTGKHEAAPTTGWPVRQMAPASQHSLWISLDGQHLWEN